MITLRSPRLVFSYPTFLTHPSLIIVFLYFFTSSADLLNLLLVLFKIKITNLIAPLLFLITLFFSRLIRIPLKFFILVLAILALMVASCWNSLNPIASGGFIAFFLFNFLFYFLGAYNLFRLYRPEILFNVYTASFYCNGFYALCQVLFSLVNVTLPGACQYIFGIARGQALTYEPSFYALYMTPFAIYSTAKFLLENPRTRKIRHIVWPNFFFLISTSTGCFFTYLFFLSFIVLFRYLKIIHFTTLSIKKLFFQSVMTFLSLFAVLWVTCKNLIISGFLKFFYTRGASHFSVQDRWRGLIEYWEIFLEHPIIGVGFGSGPFYLAQKKGIQTIDLLDSSILARYSPMNATTEVLASLGTLGALCFLCFFYLLIKVFLNALKVATGEDKIILIALALSVCVMFSTLQFNQSIMRSYMWIHIGFFCGYANHLISKNSTFTSFQKQKDTVLPHASNEIF